MEFVGTATLIAEIDVSGIATVVAGTVSRPRRGRRRRLRHARLLVARGARLRLVVQAGRHPRRSRWRLGTAPLIGAIDAGDRGSRRRRGT